LPVTTANPNPNVINPTGGDRDTAYIRVHLKFLSLIYGLHT